MRREEPAPQQPAVREPAPVRAEQPAPRNEPPANRTEPVRRPEQTRPAPPRSPEPADEPIIITPRRPSVENGTVGPQPPANRLNQGGVRENPSVPRPPAVEQPSQPRPEPVPDVRREQGNSFNNRPGGQARPPAANNPAPGRFTVIDRTVPEPRRSEFNQWLRNKHPSQPGDIKIPDHITSYRSADPPRAFERYTQLWDRSRSHRHPKREFWRQYAGHCPPVRVVTRNRYVPYPVYQYWPYRTSSYFYWGYNDYVYDPYYGSSVVVVYRPASTTYRVETVSTSDYQESSSSAEPWPGYRRDRDEVEDAARDIRDAWLKDDLELIGDHLDRDLPIRLYQEGEYLYWVQDREFLSRMRDTMEDEGTRRFEIQRVLPVRPGEVMVYAKHELRDSGIFGSVQYERYTFELVGSKWMISAYEISGRRLDPD